MSEASKAIGLTSVEPTPELRWQDGVLQQKWAVIMWRFATDENEVTYEWRDVPGNRPTAFMGVETRETL